MLDETAWVKVEICDIKGRKREFKITYEDVDCIPSSITLKFKDGRYIGNEDEFQLPCGIATIETPDDMHDLPEGVYEQEVRVKNIENISPQDFEPEKE